MRILLAIIVIAAAGWSGYWFWGQRAVETGLTEWFEIREDAGWMVDYTDIETTGFPNRFDTTITDLELTDPKTGLGWTTPFLQIFALSYKPHHIIAIWPHTQSLFTPYQTLTVTSTDMRGSLVFVPGPALALDRTTIDLETLGLVSTLGWQMSADTAQLSLRRTPAVATDSYDIAFDAREMMLPQRIGASSGDLEMGDQLATLRLRATTVFDAPWDRHAIEERRPQPSQIRIDEARVVWGSIGLRITGDMVVDADGQPTGALTIRAENWRDILRLAIATGALPPQIEPLLDRGLGMIARPSDNGETIDVKLDMSGGRFLLGGLIPLGPTPVLRLR
ncbi:MAG: DUF2125 domain-containing protein [Qingshengfaniella sp.]